MKIYAKEMSKPTLLVIGVITGLYTLSYMNFGNFLLSNSIILNMRTLFLFPIGLGIVVYILLWVPRRLERTTEMRIENMWLYLIYGIIAGVIAFSRILGMRSGTLQTIVGFYNNHNIAIVAICLFLIAIIYYTNEKEKGSDTMKFLTDFITDVSNELDKNFKGSKKYKKELGNDILEIISALESREETIRVERYRNLWDGLQNKKILNSDWQNIKEEIEGVYGEIVKKINNDDLAESIYDPKIEELCKSLFYKKAKTRNESAKVSEMSALDDDIAIISKNLSDVNKEIQVDEANLEKDDQDSAKIIRSENALKLNKIKQTLYEKNLNNLLEVKGKNELVEILNNAAEGIAEISQRQEQADEKFREAYAKYERVDGDEKRKQQYRVDSRPIEEKFLEEK